VRAFGRQVPLEYRVTEFDPPRRVVLSARNAFVRSRDVIEVSPAFSGGSIVTYRAALSLRGPAVLFMPFLGAACKRIGDRAAAGLHSVLRGGVPLRPATTTPVPG
jgi:hypothetical protein